MVRAQQETKGRTKAPTEDNKKPSIARRLSKGGREKEFTCLGKRSVREKDSPLKTRGKQVMRRNIHLVTREKKEETEHLANDSEQ